MKKTVRLKQKQKQTERLETFERWWNTLPFEEEERFSSKDIAFDKSQSIRLGERSLEDDFPLENALLNSTLRDDSNNAQLESIQLPVLFSHRIADDSDVLMEVKLGEGGMGEVWLGEQKTLRRDVAVKVIKPDVRSKRTRGKLLREAWVTGLLEHPNIIPVHVLGVDSDGSPAFAMKRVQGVSWEDLMLGNKPLPEGMQGSSVLEKHIRILKQVCNAIRYAHSKGIIHRDIKPSNVMVGSFGEVYVMDWGIAASLREEHQGWLPMATQEEGVFGTPAYMAPEMASGSNIELSESSDIFLLGATLHEFLTGEAPHDGASLVEVLMAAMHAVPKSYPPSAPKGLADICKRAMAPEPTDRFPTVEAFQKALAGFLSHRESLELSQETTQSLVQLKAQLLEKNSDTNIYQVFGQVRFGFQQALRIWDGNEEAIQGLQEAIELMIQFEMENHHSQAALALLSELPKPRPDLEEAASKLHEEVSASRADIAAFHQMRHDVDLSVRAAARSRLMMWMAVLWGIVPLLAELAHDLKWVALSAQADFLLSGAVAVMSLGFLWLWRRALWSHKINQNVLMSLGLTIVALFLLWSLGLRMGLAFSQVLALESIPLFGFYAFVAVLIDRRLIPVLILYSVVPLSSLLFPNVAPYTTSFGNMAAFVLLGWIWKQPMYPIEQHKPSPS